MHHVVIIGGGFGGLYAARSLRRSDVQVTLIDRRNFHLFQPLLYQVATGALSPGDIASPLRAVLKRYKNMRVLLSEVTDIDTARRRVILADEEVAYDTLIVAGGASHHYFGHPEWAAVAPGLKTVEDATTLRRRILFAFEAAERETEAASRRAWLTFVIVGAGPTGVELAGALAEIARHTLKDDFRNINPAEAHILLIEMAERVLPPYAAQLSEVAQIRLQRIGVTVKVGTRVVALDACGVDLQCGEVREHVPTHTVMWAAGVKASPLGEVLRERAGIELDRVGRVVVNGDCSIPDHPQVFVIGDLACFQSPEGQPLPAVAPVAMQQGRYVARQILARRRGAELPPFRYFDRGSMAVIGRNAAVAQVGRLKFSGLLAWLAWLFIHLLYLVEYQNRILVLTQWALNYFTWNRGARLITPQTTTDATSSAAGDPPSPT